jgi:hypothetical protein
MACFVGCVGEPAILHKLPQESLLLGRRDSHQLCLPGNITKLKKATRITRVFCGTEMVTSVAWNGISYIRKQVLYTTPMFGSRRHRWHILEVVNPAV